ncbi:SGNH hydrolase-type esterase domain-containing protein [Lipomyces tetrasporus]|uniref:SGNH hydrolase-type esterase domain-containing protein n=1 Tax=Lipomyces tetrasporus TaxID=54092 RepID=A0AAD7VPK2_9ASCO|nr:SGNH hydrolase-type esterase domain-containing protein [Lipomyces tetrasporus]KAJ8096866.1 SGNH hydrolase-type esterase domain-containing protein [Lipomyces tetrasporus]
MPRTPGTTVYKKVVLIGDSQFELSWNPELEFCFPAALSNYYGRRADVLNRGLAGYNSVWMRSQLDRVIHELKHYDADVALLFVLWLGTNDSCLEFTEHHVPVPEFVTNVQSYVSEIKRNFAYARILLVAPAPISKAGLAASTMRTKGTDRTQAATKEYVDALLQYSDDPNVVRKIDLFSAIVDAAGYDSNTTIFDENSPITEDADLKIAKFTVDGLHLNGNGYRELFNLVKCTLDDWDGVRASDIDGVEPGWADKARRFRK